MEFKTFEEAKNDLDKRRKIALENIENRNDILLEDKSFIDSGLKNGYVPYIMLYTKFLLDDLKNFKND